MKMTVTKKSEHELLETSRTTLMTFHAQIPRMKDEPRAARQTDFVEPRRFNRD